MPSKRARTTRSTRDTSDYSLLGTPSFNRILSRKEAASLVEKYPYIFKANNVTHSCLQGITSLDDLTAAVNIVFATAILSHGSIERAEVEYESFCKGAIVFGGPATNTARIYQVPLQGCSWVAHFWQEQWQQPSGSIYMEIRDAISNVAIALSPEDILIGDSVGVCPSIQAIEEFRSGVRDHKTEG
ncbi:hypothetical protein BT96DRAFT_914254 [Gymnopus androsaceus JB14]|uniref:Uncharacterized protein n=1 Tax=Gymnopus androsaceus JB14 TaxID=1447944 RepID=A0A6A4IGY1_9AGAR|nr:hypothetical protein BT96DRAFT_914254 [Gymnopus androsaceus JB14]